MTLAVCRRAFLILLFLEMRRLVRHARPGRPKAPLYGVLETLSRYRNTARSAGTVAVDGGWAVVHSLFGAARIPNKYPCLFRLIKPARRAVDKFLDGQTRQAIQLGKSRHGQWQTAKGGGSAKADEPAGLAVAVMGQGGCRESDMGQGAGRPTAAGGVLPDVRDRADAPHGGNTVQPAQRANDRDRN